MERLRIQGSWLALVVAAVCPCAFGGPNAPPGQTPTAQQPDVSATVRGTPDSPVYIRALPNEGSDNLSDAERRARNEKAELDRKLVKFNGDLAEYTEWLAGIAILQFLALAAQGFFLWKAFKETRRSGDIARDAMVAGERAFVFFTNIKGFWELDAATKTYSWRFRPVIINSGDTPTKHLRLHTKCILSPTPLASGFDFNYQTTEVGRGLLAPRMDSAGSLAPGLQLPAITAQQIVDVQQGKLSFYVCGWAKYRDVFPDTPEHITRFCWQILPVGNPLTFDGSKPDALRFDFLYHGEGNCADEECG